MTGGTLTRSREELRRTSVGSIVVFDVQLEPRLDRDGEEYLHIMLVISEPPQGQQTWSLDDAFTLRQRVRTTAAEFGISSGLSINMTTAGDTGTSDDDGDDDDPTRGVVD